VDCSFGLDAVRKGKFTVLTRNRTPVSKYPVTNLFTILTGNRDSSVGIVARLRTGRFRFRLPVGVRGLSLLHDVQTAGEIHSTSYATGAGVLIPGVRRPGIKLTPHPHAVPRVRISGAVCLSAVGRGNCFKFTVLTEQFLLLISNKAFTNMYNNNNNNNNNRPLKI
jgi:hypothetical protein